MNKAGNPKHPETPGHNKKTKPKDYRYRKEQGFTSYKPSKYLQQNPGRKLP